jgi:hypothetical protein
MSLPRPSDCRLLPERSLPWVSAPALFGKHSIVTARTLFVIENFAA